MERYYYKAKEGNGYLNLKSPLSKKELEKYIEITEEEFRNLTEFPKDNSKRQKLSQIASLKSQLAATDYQAIKYAEGWISEEDYAPIKAQRQAIRDQINELEG